MGNSPAEYTAERVGGKTVVLTTTNGTQALLHSRQAERVLVAAFANCSATTTALESAPEIHVLCAGSELTMSFEDTLLAGAIVHRLETRSSAEGRGISLNDQALIAKAAWVAVQSDLQAGVSLADLLRPSRGARTLIEIGQEPDIDRAAQRDWCRTDCRTRSRPLANSAAPPITVTRTLIHLPPTTYHLPPTTYQLPPTNYQLPPTPTTYQLPTTNYQLRSNYQLPTTSYELRATDH